MKTLNQLLSRVKSIFSHKAHHEEKQTEPTTQQPSVSDQRLKAALAEVEKYLADNFGTAHSALTYKEYRNGISLASDDPTFSTAVVILTRTNGMLNLPDNIILLGYVKTDKGDDYLIEHLGNFFIFLKRLGIKHCIHHLAIAFSKEHYDTPPQRRPICRRHLHPLLLIPQSTPSPRQEIHLLSGRFIYLKTSRFVISKIICKFA